MMDRDELAVKCYLVLITPFEGCAPVEDFDYATLARTATKAADALIARLRPVAPVADAAPTDPRRTVGAVVRDAAGFDWIVLPDEQTRRLDRDADGIALPLFDNERFLRWATPEECARHGIAYVSRPLPGAPPAERAAAGLDAPAKPAPARDEAEMVREFVFGSLLASQQDTDVVPGVGKVYAGSFRGDAACDALTVFLAKYRAHLKALAFDEAKERETARAAYWNENTVVCSRDKETTYIAGWLARARIAASPAKPAVDREGLIAAMEIAARKSCGDVGDQRSMTQVQADAAIAFLKANGGVA